MTGPERRYRRLVDAHFRGRLSPPGEREMRGHLVTCGPCRAHYDRHLLLARVDPGEPQVAVVVGAAGTAHHQVPPHLSFA